MKKKLGSYRRKGKSKAKIHIYFPDEIHEEINAEIERQNRPISWIMQEAWLLAREAIARIPSHRERR